MLKGGRTPPLMSDLIRIQRGAAEAQGCAFWDTREAMGGQGSMGGWRRAGLARRDGVHLKRDGYHRLADLFIEAFWVLLGPPPEASEEP